MVFNTGKETIMALSGVSSNMYGSYYTYDYGYNSTGSTIDSAGWSSNADKKTEELKESLGISDKTSGKNSSTTVNSTSGFLMGYQGRLEDLESAASKLTLGSKDNVFSKYDTVKDKMSKGEATEEDVTKAMDEVYSAVKDLAAKYNDVINYLKNNTEHGSGLSSQIDSFKRGMPTEQGLKYLGMKYDADGNVQVDEKKFKENFEKDPEFFKNALGGQFGIADRLGSKASAILDSTVDEVLNKGTASGTGKHSATSSSEPVETYGTSSVNTKNVSTANLNDSFKQFASFARGGAFNLGNYYAVSMLNILA